MDISKRKTDAPGVLQFRVLLDGKPAAFADVILAWQTDAEFRSLF